MQITTSDGHEYRLQRDPEDPTYVLISGDNDALDAFKDTVVLAGAAEVASGAEWTSTGIGVHSITYEPLAVILRAHEGTVALWAQAEILNYMI